MRVHALERAEVPVEKFSHHGAKPRFILGKSGGVNLVTEALQGMFEKFGLRMFSATVDSLDGNERSASCHVSCKWRGQATSAHSVASVATARNGLLAAVTIVLFQGQTAASCYDWKHRAMSAESSIQENLMRVREKIETAARH